MCQTVRNTLRSWMFIYAALIAAFVLAGQPAGGDDADFDNAARPLVGDAPLGRSDI